MSPMTPQGKLGLKLLLGVLGLVVVSTVLFTLRDDDPPPRELAGITVAAIVFDEPTDAWVSETGTMALVADGEGYRLATYGPGGELSSAPVDEVSVLDDHRVYDDLGVGVLVIDQTEYTLGDGGYVSGDCYWCSHEYPVQPVLADLHDGGWKVTAGDLVTVIDQPAGWDGQPPTARLDPNGEIVVVAGLKSGDTAVIDDKVCTVKGAWTLVAAPADTLLLQRVDADRRDHSVSSFERCR
jgi:hypothetical protein